MSFWYWVLVGVVGTLIASLIWWSVQQALAMWPARLRVTCENANDHGFVIRATTGSRAVRIKRYGFGAECSGGYEDVQLHKRSLIATDGRQDAVISVPAHAEVRLKPMSVGAALFPHGAKAVDNKMRVRPFVEIESRYKPYRGAWCTYDFQRQQVDRG